MKTLLSLVIFSTSFPAFAAAPRAASFAEMKDAAQDVYQGFRDQDDCHIQLTQRDGGFTLSLVDGDAHSVTLEVSQNAKITMRSLVEDSDGFSHEFRLASGASLTQTHAGDAFDEVILRAADGTKASCIIED